MHHRLIGLVCSGWVRWLRDHSAPDGLVATNSHCRNPGGTPCDSRDFWISTFAERRVLVHGWSYTDYVVSRGRLATAPYWDPMRLAENDAVFYEPTAANIAGLADRYGVRWLVAVGPDVNPDLAQLAALRFASGVVSVYEIGEVRSSGTDLDELSRSRQQRIVKIFPLSATKRSRPLRAGQAPHGSLSKGRAPVVTRPWPGRRPAEAAGGWSADE